MKQHALISPSALNRIINCPASVALTKDMPDESSPYADEGTAAHALCEYLTRAALKGALNPAAFPIEFNDFINEEMWRHAANYANFVLNEYKSLLKKTSSECGWCLESTVAVDSIDECFGTVDCALWNDKTLHIIDFKYGKGVPVFPGGNPQLMAYACGVLSTKGLNVKQVKMTIYQPRINPEGAATAQMSVANLCKWEKETLRPAANEALSYVRYPQSKPKTHWDGSGTRYCRFCKRREICRKERMVPRTVFADFIGCRAHEN